MSTITIPVSWKNNAPWAADVTVKPTDGTPTLKWVPASGSGITAITITNLPSTMFKSFSGQGTTQVTCTDENSNSKNQGFDYFINAVHSSGANGDHDPKIINGNRGAGPPLGKPRAPEPRP